MTRPASDVPAASSASAAAPRRSRLQTVSEAAMALWELIRNRPLDLEHESDVE